MWSNMFQLSRSPCQGRRHGPSNENALYVLCSFSKALPSNHIYTCIRATPPQRLSAIYWLVGNLPQESKRARVSALNILVHNLMKLIPTFSFSTAKMARLVLFSNVFIRFSKCLMVRDGSNSIAKPEIDEGSFHYYSIYFLTFLCPSQLFWGPH